MINPKAIPISELKPGMIVYYKLDSGVDDDGWDLSKSNNGAVVVMNGAEPMLIDLFHDPESESSLCWRDPVYWTPYRTKKDADLACLREALARHSRYASIIAEEIKKLTGKD